MLARATNVRAVFGALKLDTVAYPYRATNLSGVKQI